MTGSSDDRARAEPDDVALEDATWIAALLNRAVSDEEPSVDLADEARRRVDAPNSRSSHLVLVAAVAVFVLLIGGFAVMRPTPSSDLGPLATPGPPTGTAPPATSTPTTDVAPPATSPPTTDAAPGPPMPPDIPYDPKLDTQVAPFVDEPTVTGVLDLVSFTRNGDAFDVTLRWGAVEGTTYNVIASAGANIELASTEIVASATGPAQVVLHIPIAGLEGTPPDETVRYQVYTPADNGGVFVQSGPRIWVPDTIGLSSGEAIELMRITSQRATVEASGPCAAGTVCSSTPPAGSTASGSENLADPPVTVVSGR